MSAEDTTVETVSNVQFKQPRQKKGRAARRRRRKLRDIQQAEDAIHQGRPIALNDDNNSNSASSSGGRILPTDRNQTWPAVYERRTFHKWSPDDERVLVGQLGYVPGNVIHISTRVSGVACLRKQSSEQQQQEPVVVQLYPMVLRDHYVGGRADGRRFKARKRKRLVNDRSTAAVTTATTESNSGGDNVDNGKSLIEPFPTTYWLTHPTLRLAVSKLELDALGVQLEKRLAADPQAMASMKRAHTAYGVERQQLLTEQDRSLVTERKWDDAFAETRGVAGIRNHAAIKCLHAHVAHVLSRGSGSSDNVVGKWVLEAVEEILKEN